jgi:nucleotide-binding universal stress UspA family protein
LPLSTPVIIIIEEFDVEHTKIFKRILFCTDFNTDAMAAFHYGVSIASANQDSELIIFHVVPEAGAQFWKSYVYEVDDVDDKAKKDMDEKITQIYLKHLPEGIRVSSRCVMGNVGEKIIEAAENDNIDLIIIGRGPGHNLINRLLGNFTEKVIRKAPCPVLVIPDE